jgi:hypothetical protein
MITVFCKLLNGFKAAMVLAGIVILFSIAGQEFLFSKRWTYAGIHETFLAVILLGLLLGWCFPVKVKKYCRAIFVVPSIVLFLVVNLYLAIGEHKSTPREIKLADCSERIVNIHLTAPGGRHYVLFLSGLPAGHMTNGNYISSYKFTGHLLVMTDKSQTMSIALNSDKMFASPGELNLGPVNLEAGKDYDLKIEFDPPPPPSSFISLYWMQSYADQKE